MAPPRVETVTLEIKGKSYDVPQAYVCPLMLDIMTQPLVSRSGHRFERAAIEDWVAQAGTNPLTREKMSLRDLIPDYHLQDEIRFWKESNELVPRASHDHSDVDCSSQQNNSTREFRITPMIIDKLCTKDDPQSESVRRFGVSRQRFFRFGRRTWTSPQA